jgi:pantoate--beta-alanine ligase
MIFFLRKIISSLFYLINLRRYSLKWKNIVMRVISKVDEMQRLSDAWKKKGDKLGFVPTMGALHAGHAALIRHARRENNKVVVSVFVNPTQFGPKEDFKKYPRPFSRDRRLCEALGVNILYHPSAKEIYPEGFRTFVIVEGLSEKLCGRFRPGHFRGVATIVLKLFEAVGPERAYFGEKDYQQLTIIKTMARDLNLPSQIIGCPTIREKDGLALSSRNRYLSPKEREAAPLFYEALSNAVKKTRPNIAPPKILSEAKREILKIQGSVIDYVSLVKDGTLEDVKKISGRMRIVAAMRLGNTRLIDNIAFSC